MRGIQHEVEFLAVDAGPVAVEVATGLDADIVTGTGTEVFGQRRVGLARQVRGQDGLHREGETVRERGREGRAQHGGDQGRAARNNCPREREVDMDRSPYGDREGMWGSSRGGRYTRYVPGRADRFILVSANSGYACPGTPMLTGFPEISRVHELPQ